MPHGSEINKTQNQRREELKIFITGDKPKNLLAGNFQSGAAAYSKPMTDLFEAVSERALAQIAKDNPGRKIVLLSGLELGIEQAAARRALEMGIEVRAFIPYKEHGKNWSDEFQKSYRDLLSDISAKGSVVQLSDKEYSPQRAQLRDYRIAEEAQTIISLHNPNAIPAHQKTLDYAAKHSKGIVNIWNDAKKQLGEISKNFDNPHGRNFTRKRLESPEIATASQTQNQESKKIEIRERITRQDLRAEPDKIFLFGDNLKQAGYGGQAKEMRGEENAVGIPTKKVPSNREDSFFTDKEFDANKKAIDEAFGKIPPGKTIVVPRGGIGTGLARLEEKAPQTFAYLNAKLSGIGFDNRRGQEINANAQTGGNKVIVQNSPDSQITAARLLDLSDIKTENLRLLSPTSKEIDALKIDRAEALSNYAERLRRDYKANKGALRDGLKTVSDALDKGEQITIACNCRNGAMCHADVVKMAIEKINLHVKNQKIQEKSRSEYQSRSVETNSKNDSPKIESGLNPRTQRAIAEILAASETDKLLEKINQSDGRNQSEQASHLGKFSQFVRDLYERGGTLAEGKLIVPKENLSLAPQLAVTTESYAVERIGKILNDESRAKEIAPRLVEYGNQIAGLSTADGETKLKVFAWMYDSLEGKSALLENDHRGAQNGESRRDRFDNALESIARLAEQMHALEPMDKIEFAPLSDFEPNEKSGSVWEERDENRVLEEIYENAVGRDADGEITERGAELGEEIQSSEHGFDSEAGAKIAAAEGYERIDLSDKAPSLPAEFTEQEIDRLLTETLPEIDRQLESGVSVKEILKPFHENVRQSAKDDALNRLEATFQRQKIGELETKLLDSQVSNGQKEKIENEIARWKSLVLTPTAEEAREILAGRAANDLKGKQTIAEFTRKTGNLSEGIKEQIERIDVRRQNVIELATPGEFRGALETGEKTFYQKTKIETAELLSKLEDLRDGKENSLDKSKENQIKKQLNELRDLRPLFAFKLENSTEIIVGQASAKSLEERAFVTSYVNFQLKQPETRLRHESERYRIYADRLEAATTRGEVIKTAAEIRIENAALGLNRKGLENGDNDKQPRPLSQKELQFLFTETSPAHYTAEMTVARLSFAHAGESRRRMTEALIKGEIKPSPEAQKLIDSLESRLTRAKLQDSIGATRHFFESLKTPNENLKYKNAFDHLGIYRNLPPQEKDFVYAKATAQRENLEYRFAFEQRRQIFGKASSRDELQTQQPPSRTEKSFYFQSHVNQARILGERVETSPLVSKEIDERDFRAAAVLLQNQPLEKINGFSHELKQSANAENRKLGEILETFGKAEIAKADGKTTVEIKLPENALLATETYKELLERFYPDDRRESDKFKFSSFGEKTIEVARIKGQDETIKTWREELGGNVYANGTSAAIFQTERAIVEHLSGITRLRQAAGDARAENARILEKYSSRAAHKLQTQKLPIPTAAEQKQIVKAALGFSGGDCDLTADPKAKQFLEAAQKEITISDLNRFEANEKLIAENMTGIKRGFSEIAARQNVLDESKVKFAGISAETRLQDAYLKTQQLEENRLLTFAARAAFEQETALDMKEKTIGDLVAQNEKDEIRIGSAARARVALEPEYKNFEEKEYNEQALKLRDAIENAHELSKAGATPEKIAGAFEIAETQKNVLLQKAAGKLEKPENKPLSLRLYEAEIQKAEKRLLAESLRDKLASDKNILDTQKTFNLETVFTLEEREQIKLRAAGIAKERLEPKELDADHRKISPEAGRRALATFKQLERAHNIFQFSNDQPKIREAFAKLDTEAAQLFKIRQDYNRAEKLAVLRDGIKSDIADLLRKNLNLKGNEFTEQTGKILQQNFEKIGVILPVGDERRITTLSREISEKIETRQKSSAKENMNFDHAQKQTNGRELAGKIFENAPESRALKNERAKESFVHALR
jgi:uncharacterized phage-like protein YoqJ